MLRPDAAPKAYRFIYIQQFIKVVTYIHLQNEPLIFETFTDKAGYKPAEIRRRRNWRMTFAGWAAPDDDLLPWSSNAVGVSHQKCQIRRGTIWHVSATNDEIHCVSTRKWPGSSGLYPLSTWVHVLALWVQCLSRRRPSWNYWPSWRFSAQPAAGAHAWKWLEFMLMRVFDQRDGVQHRKIARCRQILEDGTTTFQRIWVSLC